ncbi:hypothetical protein [Nicoliella lavandulae]|uniref:Uncharacterized protein n=1 Tax=Nicoliella lavandulae TaxID=3082954 RepID=A0ABU8SJ75_9LACO
MYKHESLEDLFNPMKTTFNSHQIRRLLKCWYYYEHNLGKLEGIEFLRAKSLFFRLSYLTKDERAFLAYRYYYASKQEMPNIKQVAKHFYCSVDKMYAKEYTILIKMFKPVLEPFKQSSMDNDKTNISDNETPDGAIIEQLFNELQKLHSK